MVQNYEYQLQIFHLLKIVGLTGMLLFLLAAVLMVFMWKMYEEKNINKFIIKESIIKIHTEKKI